ARLPGPAPDRPPDPAGRREPLTHGRQARVVAVGLGVALFGPGLAVSADLAPPCDATVRVPAGAFPMGARVDDPEASPDERPRHVVTLAAYDIDVHEVTRDCFARFVTGGGYESEASWPRDGWNWRTARGVARPSFWDAPGFQDSSWPVVGVSWFE